MTDMQNFISFFVNQLPAFLMSEPIKYFVGFWFAGCAVLLIKRILNISK